MTIEAVPPLLLDVSRLVWRAWVGLLPTGIDRTVLAYVRHFGPRARAVLQRSGFTRILSRDASTRLFDLLLAGGPGVRADLIRLAPALLGAREPLPVGAIYLNVGHTGLDRPSHAAWVRRTGVKACYFIHDLIPLTHPEYCRPGEPEKHGRRIDALLALGGGIIGNSRDTLDMLAAFAEQVHRPALMPTLVSPLGIPSLEAGQGRKAAELELTGAYFVMLGTLEGRKNHLLILNIWAEMARRLGAACPRLIIIGQRGWECEQAVDMLERCAAIKGQVTELPRCDDAMLGAYMRGARALLFPSFVEGYGLPLVEALACGTPVIASDLAVFQELAGDIPDYLSPVDGLGWMNAIENYAREDSAMRAAQIGRMSGWTAPTWADHFARVDAFLEELSHRPG
ncbi:MAG TPA: glycosyltransferase family 1 protein [Sphingobium sp.]|nr:glycosyltransferase family 1 protein [Sphingobium sp.]